MNPIVVLHQIPLPTKNNQKLNSQKTKKNNLCQRRGSKKLRVKRKRVRKKKTKGMWKRARSRKMVKVQVSQNLNDIYNCILDLKWKRTSQKSLK